MIDHDTAIRISKECLLDAGLAVDAQHVIDDIKRVTCLLLEEGKKFQFVHSSVQEFFAARFVKTRTEPVAASFYKQLVDKSMWIYWQEELLFLKQIDSYRAAKYFFMQDLEKTLQYLLIKNTLTPSDAAIKYLEGMAVVKKMEDRNGMLSPKYNIQRIRKESLTYYLQVLDSRVFTQLFSGVWNKGFIADGTSTLRTCLQIAKDQSESKYADMLALVASIIASQQNELMTLKRTITNEEKTTGLINLTI